MRIEVGANFYDRGAVEMRASSLPGIEWYLRRPVARTYIQPLSKANAAAADQAAPTAPQRPTSGYASRTCRQMEASVRRHRNLNCSYRKIRFTCGLNVKETIADIERI